MAFTNLTVDNFTIIDSFVFTNTNSPSYQNNYAFCQVRTSTRGIFVSYLNPLYKRASKGQQQECFHNNAGTTVNVHQICQIVSRPKFLFGDQLTNQTYFSSFSNESRCDLELGQYKNEYELFINLTSTRDSQNMI